MSTVGFSSQTVKLRNPFVPLAMAQLAAGLLVAGVSAWCLSRTQPYLTNPRFWEQLGSAGPLTILLLVFASAAGLAWGVTMLAMGGQSIGPWLVVPPRTPVDLQGIETVANVLVRQEFNDLRLPSDGVLADLQRFQRGRVFYATPREAVLVRESLTWARRGLLLLVVTVVALFFTPPNLREALPAPLRGVVLWGVLGLLVAAIVRSIAIPSLLSLGVPSADRDEHTRMIRGGGDPAALQPLVWQDLLRLREGETPNRELREFGTRSGTVQDTGDYRANMWVETQPVPELTPPPALTWLYLGSALGLVLAGTVFAVVGALQQTVTAVFVNTLVAAVWIRIGHGLFESAAVYLGRFRFTSTIALLLAEGTIGRSEIKAGKAWNDSFESANLVVRSDSTVRLYTATIATETYTTTLRAMRSMNASRRFLLEATRDERSDQAMRLVVETLDKFERAGTVVRPLEPTDGGLQQLAQANLAYRQAAASIPSAPPALEAGPSAAFQIPASASAPAGADLAEASAPPPTSAGDTRECPMCAETIKAAAKKCRFCGHMLVAEGA